VIFSARTLSGVASLEGDYHSVKDGGWDPLVAVGYSLVVRHLSAAA
jgi:hypothetical protein